MTDLLIVIAFNLLVGAIWLAWPKPINRAKQAHKELRHNLKPYELPGLRRKIRSNARTK